MENQKMEMLNLGDSSGETKELNHSGFCSSANAAFLLSLFLIHIQLVLLRNSEKYSLLNLWKEN